MIFSLRHKQQQQPLVHSLPGASHSSALHILAVQSHHSPGEGSYYSHVADGEGKVQRG